VWRSELLTAAEQAAGIPLFSRLGWHQIIRPGNTPWHQPSPPEDEASCPPSSRKHHDRSLAPMLNLIKLFHHLMQIGSREHGKKERAHRTSVPLPLGTASLGFSFQRAGRTLRQNLDTCFHRGGGAPMRILCAINPHGAIQKIADDLGLPSKAPPIAPAALGRCSAQPSSGRLSEALFL
jgi:hypothetical protein